MCERAKGRKVFIIDSLYQVGVEARKITRWRGISCHDGAPGEWSGAEREYEQKD